MKLHRQLFRLGLWAAASLLITFCFLLNIPTSSRLLLCSDSDRDAGVGWACNTIKTTPFERETWYRVALPGTEQRKVWKFGGRIVLGSTYWHTYDYSPVGLSNTTFDSCPYKCAVHVPTSKSEMLKSTDTVVLHAFDAHPKRIRMLPGPRHPDQVWVVLWQEGPATTGDSMNHFEELFNWTMTYRQDSDVVHPYGFVSHRVGARRREKLEPNTLQKTRMAAAIISHCTTNGNRESYISELQDYIQVDVYGACGNFSCPSDGLSKCNLLDVACRLEQYQACPRALAREYKFFLAFENSLCKDYVTEKFWYALRTGGMVPVVYGGADYARLAPPHSFIDARAFDSPRALAGYLHHLDTHPDEYAVYFKWKQDYVVDVRQTRGWCDLCTKLHTLTDRQTYTNLPLWWWSGTPYLNPADESTVRSLDVCTPRPKYSYEGWRDASKNHVYYIGGRSYNQMDYIKAKVDFIHRKARVHFNN